MAFFNLCTDDPIVSELREVFKANIIRIPEERIAPLAILISSKKSVKFIGQVDSLMEEPTFKFSAADFHESDMASLTNKRSRVLDNAVGVEILSGLLSGMGMGATPDVSADFKNSNTIRFHFPAVTRRYIEIANIGRLLSGRTFDRKNLVFKTLLDPGVTVHLIDSIITSTNFEIEAGDEAEASLKVDVQKLQKMLADASIEVVSKGAKQIAFRSKRRLAFAFTCVNLSISGNGAIRSVAPSLEKIGSPQLADPRKQERGQEAHALLTRTPQLIDVEFNS